MQDTVVYLPVLRRIGPQSMLMNPMVFSVDIVKVYNLPATRFETMALITSTLAISIGVRGLIARPSSYRYTTDKLVRGSPPVWMYDHETVMSPLDDNGALQVGAGTVSQKRKNS